MSYYAETEQEREERAGALIDRWETEAFNRLRKERDEARAEVDRLRDVVRQVHALVRTVRATAVLDDIEKLREIHKLTKGMVE